MLRSSQPAGTGTKSRGEAASSVHTELVLQARDGAKNALLLGQEKDVDVERARAPAEKNGSGAACEIDRSVLGGFRTEPTHEAADPVSVG